MGFDQLQRRLGRKTVGSTLKRECPMRFVAYDLLEHEGVDTAANRRSTPTAHRTLPPTDHPEGWDSSKSQS